MLSLILAGLNNLMAQGESYDIFTFNPQPGWKRSDFKDNIQFTLQQGNVWAIIGLYKSLGTTGNIESDFQFDWNDLIKRNYSISGDLSKEQNIVNGWQMITGITTGTIKGQKVNIILITFTGQSNHTTIIITNNDFNGILEGNIQNFMAGLSVITIPSSQTAVSADLKQNQPPSTDNYLPPQVSGNPSQDFPTPGARIVTRTTSSDGWLVEATNDYIQYSNPEIKVIQYFFVAPEDPNSNTDDEDLFWRKFLSGYFSANQYNKFPNEPYAFMDRVESASGYSVSKADGKSYFLVWIVSLGMKCSFLAITGNESLYKKYFSHPNDLVALERYNYFTATPDDLQGKWEESGFAGAQMYYSTGAYAGMSVASTAEEWTFSGNSTRYFANGATGTVGALNTFTVEEFGTFQLNGNDLTVKVTKPATKTHEFWCGFVAGKGGLLLKLANKKFTAQIDFLRRKEQ